MREAQSFESPYSIFEDAEFAQATEVNEPYQAKLPALLLRVCTLVLLSLMFALPIWFGGVHSPIFLSARILCFITILAFIFCRGQYLYTLFSRKHFSKTVVLGGASLLIYAFLQIILFSFFHTTHPVLGEISANISLRSSLSLIGEFIFFLSVFILVRAYLHYSSRNIIKFHRAILAAGLVVSLIALSHWFYDNGMLFWTFKPDHFTISERARWPFVNPNHLGHFLLPLVFFLVALLLSNFQEIRNNLHSKFPFKKPSLSLLIGQRSLQHGVIRAFFILAFILSASLAILGTLSRSTWLGASVGILAFIFGEKLLKKEVKEEGSKLVKAFHTSTFDSSEERTSRRKRSRSSRSKESITFLSVLNLIRPFVKPLFFVLAVLSFYLFLQGRGTELLESRVEYSLLYSLDDMRWQLYSDTLSMIRDHLFFGVGLGNWITLYPQYMDPGLSGLDPVYLHSEPMQILAEIGLLGSLIILGMVTILTSKTISAIRNEESKNKFLLLGLFCGFLSIGTACFLDFTFRIPALTFYMAVYLALLAYYVEEKEDSSGTTGFIPTT